MKKMFFFLLLLLSTGGLMAQGAYQFQVIKENRITAVKNQSSTGTCWSFSGVSFLESELLRMGKGEFDLSEMYIVRRSIETCPSTWAP